MLRNFKFLTFFFMALLGLNGCKKDASSGQIVKALPGNTPILEYQGGSLKAKDVEELVKPEITRLNEEAIDTYKRAAERILVEKLLQAEAKKRGLNSMEELLEAEGTEAAVTEQEIDEIHQKANDQKTGYRDPVTGKVRSVSKDEVRQYLSQEKQRQAQQNLVRSLLAEAKPKQLLKEPRTEVPGNPESYFVGGKNAKVVIHEFSDFQCPYCSQAKEVVSQLKDHYGDKVKIYFRHLVLGKFPESMPAAIASVCAGKQKKFWEMHDKLFDNQRQVNAGNITQWAKELKLDMASFESCQKSKDSEAVINKDVSIAQDIGATSTPVFFVNGKKIPGALPFAQFQQIIDEELGQL